MKKYFLVLTKSILIVLIWFTLLQLFAVYRIKNYGVSPQFPYYNTLLVGHRPTDLVWGYFDGTHYLHLAEFGYDSTGPQAFFPLYPMLVRVVHNLTGIAYYPLAISLSLFFLGLSLSLIPYLFSEFWWYCLVLMFFPTSFFFGSVYTESLFLFLSLLFFLLVSRRKFTLAAIVAALASGTRLVGVFLAASLFIELIKAKRPKYQIFLLPLVAASGLISYMLFLSYKFSDPLMFLHMQTLFGAERSSDHLILLPQVLYRYLKMLFTVDPSSLLYQRVWLELVAFIGAFGIWIINIKKIPLSWSLFVGSSLILPTLTGTLSSLPRYALVIVPLIAHPPQSRILKISLLTISMFLLLYLFWLYSGGSFIA